MQISNWRARVISLFILSSFLSGSSLSIFYSPAGHRRSNKHFRTYFSQLTGSLINRRTQRTYMHRLHETGNRVVCDVFFTFFSRVILFHPLWRCHRSFLNAPLCRQPRHESVGRNN